MAATRTPPFGYFTDYYTRTEVLPGQSGMRPPSAHCDVQPSPAISGEHTRLIVDGRSADNVVAMLLVGTDDRELQIAKAPACVEMGLVFYPFGFGENHIGQLPVRQTDDFAGTKRVGSGDFGEPKVTVLLPRPVAGHVDQQPEVALLFTERFKLLLLLQTPAQLAADEFHCLQRPIIRFADTSIRKRQNADNAALRSHRKYERTTVAGFRRQCPWRRTCIADRIWNPQRLARLTYPARQAGVRSEHHVARSIQKFLDNRQGRSPGFLETQHVACSIQAEVAAAIPAFRLAYRAND